MFLGERKKSPGVVLTSVESPVRESSLAAPSSPRARNPQTRTGATWSKSWGRNRLHTHTACSTPQLWCECQPGECLHLDLWENEGSDWHDRDRLLIYWRGGVCGKQGTIVGVPKETFLKEQLKCAWQEPCMCSCPANKEGGLWVQSAPNQYTWAV